LLRARRKDAGLTQRELADRAGVSVGMVRDLEQGRTRHPRPGSVTRLAEELGLDPSQAYEPARSAGEADRGAAGPWCGTGQDAQPRGALSLRVLGPLAAWRDGLPAGLGEPRQRAILGLVALNPNMPVHREALIDAAWGETPPATVVNLVQAYVSRLRRILDPGRAPRDPGGLLVSGGNSYRLQATAGQLDLLAFSQLTGDARAAVSSGDLAGACDSYERALDLWEGEPLADVDALRGHPAVIGLGRTRAEVITEYAEACSGAGRPDRVLPHVRALAGREPLNEKAHTQLMIALAGSGQQAAALQVFEDLRRRLDEQLGVRPGPGLTAAHMRVLRQEVRVDDGRPGPVQAGRVAVPRQLPGAVRHFVGRTAELEALTGLLAEAGTADGTAMISVIGGTAGVGKTALAVQWAHQIAHRLPDGQLYVNLRGFDPSGSPVTPAEALRGFLDALRVPPEHIPSGLDAQAALYRSLLAGRRMLIVLDNASDAGQVRPLLPAGPACLVLVTSRSQLTGLVATEGAFPLTLDVLTDGEARELLACRLGAGRVADEADAVAELTGLCARLPLALSITAARAAARPGFPLATMVAELREAAARGRLDALDAGDAASSVRVVFSWSCRQLDPAAARMFRLLGVHPGPDISAPAAASLADVPLARAREALRELAGARLLAEHVPGRFAFHDLLRAYAAEQADASESQAGRRAAVHRVLDHYLHTACGAAVLLNPARERVTPAPPQPGAAPESPADDRHAMAWFDAEHRVLLAVIEMAVDSGFDAHAWQIPWALATYLDRRGHWRDWAAIQHAALAAARRLGDQAGQAHAHRSMGRVQIHLGRYGDARAHLSQALSLYRQLGDRISQARVRQDVGRVCERQGQYREALSHVRQALALFRAAGHRAGQADALNLVGWHLALLGKYQQALVYCQQALGLHRELQDRLGQADTWDSLGYARHHLGHHSEAIACYQHAIDLYRELGDRYNRTLPLTHLGDIYRAAGAPLAARDAWQQALAILDDLHHCDAEQVRARLRDLDVTMQAGT